MLKEKTLSKKDIENMEEEVSKEVEASYDFAVNSPEPDLDRFLEEVKAI